MSNEDLLAELFLDLKGPKKKRDDWISIAKKCKRAAKAFGSTENAAEKLGVSYELLRSIITLLSLPEEIQALIKERKILYDAAQRLYRIDDPKKQIQVARAIVGLPSHQQREIIQYSTKQPAANIEEFRSRVVRPSKIKEKVHISILPLRAEIYRILANHSRVNKSSVEKTILRIIEDWVRTRG